MNIAKLPRGDKYPQEFNLVIEIPRNSHNKYEYDEELEVIKLDRVYSSTMKFPYDYGFIPETRSEDGDHLDGLVLLDEPAYPGIVVPCRPIGVIYMVDSGEKDEKIVAVPIKDPRYTHITDLDQLSPHFQKEIQHYYEHYKDLEGKEVKINGWGNKTEALKVMQDSIED